MRKPMTVNELIQELTIVRSIYGEDTLVELRINDTSEGIAFDGDLEEAKVQRSSETGRMIVRLQDKEFV